MIEGYSRAAERKIFGALDANRRGQGVAKPEYETVGRFITLPGAAGSDHAVERQWRWLDAALEPT